MKKRMTYLTNHYLQKWFGLPTTAVELDGPRAARKRTFIRVARRLPGLREAQAYEDESRFAL
jgi:hypothetical protein